MGGSRILSSHHSSLKKGLNVTTFIGVLLIIAGLILLYALVIRPWLKKLGLGAELLLRRSRQSKPRSTRSQQTVLVGRLVWVGGFIVSAFHDSISPSSPRAST